MQVDFVSAEKKAAAAQKAAQKLLVDEAAVKAAAEKEWDFEWVSGARRLRGKLHHQLHWVGGSDRWGQKAVQWVDAAMGVDPKAIRQCLAGRCLHKWVSIKLRKGRHWGMSPQRVLGCVGWSSRTDTITITLI